MDKQLKEKAIRLFDEKKYCKSCFCCNSDNLKVLNGFFINIIQDDPFVHDLSCMQKEAIPTIVYYCNDCGYVMQFNLGVYLNQ